MSFGLEPMMGGGHYEDEDDDDFDEDEDYMPEGECRAEWVGE